MRHKTTIAVSVAAALVLVAVACTAPKGTPKPNVAPVAVILADPQAGAAPLKVNFSGVDSTDSDGSVTDDGGADEPTCGTPAAPCASISYGITRAGTDSKDQVWVAEGENSAFTVVEDIDVRGGYGADFTGAGDASVVNGSFDARTRCAGCWRPARRCWAPRSDSRGNRRPNSQQRWRVRCCRLDRTGRLGGRDLR